MSGEEKIKEEKSENTALEAAGSSSDAEQDAEEEVYGELLHPSEGLCSYSYRFTNEPRVQPRLPARDAHMRQRRENAAAVAAEASAVAVVEVELTPEWKAFIRQHKKEVNRAAEVESEGKASSGAEGETGEAEEVGEGENEKEPEADREHEEKVSTNRFAALEENEDTPSRGAKPEAEPQTAAAEAEQGEGEGESTDACANTDRDKEQQPPSNAMMTQRDSLQPFGLTRFFGGESYLGERALCGSPWHPLAALDGSAESKSEGDTFRDRDEDVKGGGAGALLAGAVAVPFLYPPPPVQKAQPKKPTATKTQGKETKMGTHGGRESGEDSKGQGCGEGKEEGKAPVGRGESKWDSK